MESREPRQHKSSYLSGYIGSGKKPGVLLARLIAALFVLLGLAAASAGAADCSNLLGLKLKDTVITEATVIAAKDDVPEYCRVQGGLETVILVRGGASHEGVEQQILLRWRSRLQRIGSGTHRRAREGIRRGRFGYRASRLPLGCVGNVQQSAIASELRASRHSLGGAAGEGSRQGVLRHPGSAFLFLRMFERRQDGAHGGASGIRTILKAWSLGAPWSTEPRR